MSERIWPNIYKPEDFTIRDQNAIAEQANAILKEVFEPVEIIVNEINKERYFFKKNLIFKEIKIRGEIP